MRLSVATNFDPALVDARREALAAYDALFRSLDGGGMWRYLPSGGGRGGP